MSNKATRIRNWSNYNKSLVQRGNITLWIEENLFNEEETQTQKRGRPTQYQSGLIDAGILLKNLFHLSFRALEGFLYSLTQLMGIDSNIPHYTTFYRRQNHKSLQRRMPQTHNEPVHVIVDSTGLKMIGEGEWCRKKHESSYQRTWRKIHLAIDGDSLDILSHTITTSRVQDGHELKPLVDNIQGPIDRITGDGAYDKFECYEVASQRGAKGIFPPQHGARLSTETKYRKKAAGPEALKQRDLAISKVRESDKKTWKKEVGYHKRSLVETTMYRLKHLLGERLKSKKIEHQNIEVQAKCVILNTFNKLGMPKRSS